MTRPKCKNRLGIPHTKPKYDRCLLSLVPKILHILKAPSFEDCVSQCIFDFLSFFGLG